MWHRVDYKPGEWKPRETNIDESRNWLFDVLFTIEYMGWGTYNILGDPLTDDVILCFPLTSPEVEFTIWTYIQ